MGIDVSKYVLGGVLSSIVGDDANAFGAFHWEENYFDSVYAAKSKVDLFERLDWEIVTPEAPDTIRQRLIEAKKRLVLLDWSKKEEFIQAKKIWYEEIRNWLEKELEENKVWKEAEIYCVDIAGPQLSPYWQAFLGFAN